MSYRIFVTGRGIAEEAQQLLTDRNCTCEMSTPADTQETLIEKLRTFNPHGIIVKQGRITEEVLDATKALRVICKHGIGTDIIDIEAATKRGIPVMFTPKANYESVAEHTLGLVLSLLRQIPLQDKHIRNGVFDKLQYDVRELHGKTLGIIGFGRTGRRLAELVGPFKINVLVYKPLRAVDSLPPYASLVRQYSEFFPVVDIVSVHCPLTPETKEMINRHTISQMKQGAYLINTARGGIVNEGDLIQALQSRRLGGAALDVFEVEPPVANNPLFSLDNVIFTAHIAGLSDNSLANMSMSAVRNVLAILDGEAFDMDSLKNREVLEK